MSFTTPRAGGGDDAGGDVADRPARRTLNGSANPNGAATTGWFRYATTDPGTCNDTFGTRVPSPAAAEPRLRHDRRRLHLQHDHRVSLTPGTTYYYCAIAQNSVRDGVRRGACRSRRRRRRRSRPASATRRHRHDRDAERHRRTRTAATTTGWFRYSATSTRARATTPSARASRRPAARRSARARRASPFSQIDHRPRRGRRTTSARSRRTRRASAFGSVLCFTTPRAPTVTTTLAVSGSRHQRHAERLGEPERRRRRPAGSATARRTRAPATTRSARACRPAGGTDLGAGHAAASAFSQPITGLTPGTTYYFCAIASQRARDGVRRGACRSRRRAEPTVTTAAATRSTSSTAHAQRLGEPERRRRRRPGSATRRPTRAPATTRSARACRPTGGTQLGSGTTARRLQHDQRRRGLVAGHDVLLLRDRAELVRARRSARCCRSRRRRRADGDDRRPRRAHDDDGDAQRQRRTRTAATTTGWFRYATTNPGTCNDTFGTRAPATGGTSARRGHAQRRRSSQAITGLTPGTTYYFCAIAPELGGHRRSARCVSFTTPAPPTVTTHAAPTSVTQRHRARSTARRTRTARGDRLVPLRARRTRAPATTASARALRRPAARRARRRGTASVAYSQPLTRPHAGHDLLRTARSPRTRSGPAFGAVVSFTDARRSRR